ncbi:MAG: ABC transporter substrate-binding protein [Minisyncoccia bacterium]
MFLLRKIFSEFSPIEKKWFFGALAALFLALVSGATLGIKEKGVIIPIAGGSYREGFIGQPIALNPITSNNPIDQEMSSVVFGRLSEFIAAYEASPDGLTYSIKLKEKLKWSDGQPLTSDDVIFTIRTAQNQQINSPYLKSWQGIGAERGSEIQIKLTLPTPYAFFGKNIENLPVIPKHIFGSIPIENFRLSDYNLEPVGSGPYQYSDFTKRKDGFITQFHFIPNPNYIGSKPYIKNIYFIFFENANDLVQAMELHKVNGFGSAVPLGFDVSGLKGFKTDKVPMSDYYAVFFNQNSNPLLKDAGIRSALIASIDKNEIIEKALGGDGVPVDNPGFISYDPASFGDNSSFNKDSAVQTIAAFKARNKNEAINIALTVPDADFLKKTAEIIKNDWLAAGVDQVNIITFNPSESTDATIKSRDYEMLIFGNILENPTDIFPFWHSSQKIYPGFNLALYQNSKTDGIIESVRQTEEEAKQKDLLSQAQKIIANDAPAAFLFSLPYTYIHSNDLGGLTENFLTNPANRFMNISDWYVATVKVIK